MQLSRQQAVLSDYLILSSRSPSEGDSYCLHFTDENPAREGKSFAPAAWLQSLPSVVSASVIFTFHLSCD